MQQLIDYDLPIVFAGSAIGDFGTIDGKLILQHKLNSIKQKNPLPFPKSERTKRGVAQNHATRDDGLVAP